MPKPPPVVTLTLRSWSEADGAIGDIDLRGMNVMKAFICEEKGVIVGVCTGHSNGGDTYIADITEPLLPNRWDILVALLEREAIYAIGTGHVWALAKIPPQHCTGIAMTTPNLTNGLANRLGMTWADAGTDMVTGEKTKEMNPYPLTDVLSMSTTFLDKLGVVRVQNA